MTLASPRKRVLIFTDRDGTLITDHGFLGKEPDWREHISLLGPVVDAIAALQRAHGATVVVVSNQAGVAWRHFPEERVREITVILDGHLRDHGVTVARWEYCPDVDASYAYAKGIERFDPRYVKNRTDRKPSPAMGLRALEAIGKTLHDFDAVVMLGDSEDDRGFAAAISAVFIDVKGEGWQAIIETFADGLDTV